MSCSPCSIEQGRSKWEGSGRNCTWEWYIKWSKPSINGLQLLNPGKCHARTRQKLLQASSGNKGTPFDRWVKGSRSRAGTEAFSTVRTWADFGVALLLFLVESICCDCYGFHLTNIVDLIQLQQQRRNSNSLALWLRLSGLLRFRVSCSRGDGFEFCHGRPESARI